MTATAAPAFLVQRFATALLTLDEAALTEISTDDISWSIPGPGRISGVHVGAPAIIAIATTIRQHRITIEVEQILTGRDGVTAILHEVSAHAEEPLDVRVALVLLFRHGRVATITGFIADGTSRGHSRIRNGGSAHE
jgi:ketosteroid isomerase-like protein